MRIGRHSALLLLAALPGLASAADVCLGPDLTRAPVGATEVQVLYADVPSARFPGRWQQGRLEGLIYRIYPGGAGMVGPAPGMEAWRIHIACDAIKRQCQYERINGAPDDGQETARIIGRCLLGPDPAPPPPEPMDEAAAADPAQADPASPDNPAEPAPAPAPEPAETAAPAPEATTSPAPPALAAEVRSPAPAAPAAQAQGQASQPTQSAQPAQPADGPTGPVAQVPAAPSGPTMPPRPVAPTQGPAPTSPLAQAPAASPPAPQAGTVGQPGPLTSPPPAAQAQGGLQPADPAPSVDTSPPRVSEPLEGPASSPQAARGAPAPATGPMMIPPRGPAIDAPQASATGSDTGSPSAALDLAESSGAETASGGPPTPAAVPGGGGAAAVGTTPPPEDLVCTWSSEMRPLLKPGTWAMTPTTSRADPRLPDSLQCLPPLPDDDELTLNFAASQGTAVLPPLSRGEAAEDAGAQDGRDASTPAPRMPPMPPAAGRDRTLPPAAPVVPPPSQALPPQAASQRAAPPATSRPVPATVARAPAPPAAPPLHPLGPQPVPPSAGPDRPAPLSRLALTRCTIGSAAALGREDIAEVGRITLSIGCSARLGTRLSFTGGVTTYPISGGRHGGNTGYNYALTWRISDRMALTYANYAAALTGGRMLAGLGEGRLQLSRSLPKFPLGSDRYPDRALTCSAFLGAARSAPVNAGINCGVNVTDRLTVRMTALVYPPNRRRDSDPDFSYSASYRLGSNVTLNYSNHGNNRWPWNRTPDSFDLLHGGTIGLNYRHEF